jgi:bifunctional non-homologous end joining protein LigD
VTAKNAILDGEIVCVDSAGRSLFKPLLFRLSRPVFAAFDVLWVDGADLRQQPLLERKGRLPALLPIDSPHVLHVDYLPEKGKELFALARENDLEGVVGKWAHGTYQSGGRTTSWVKVKNPNYSQAEGRAEFFGKRARARRAQAPQLKLA